MVDPDTPSPNLQTRGALLGLLLGAAGLGLLVVWVNFLLFHCLVDLASAAIAACIAMIAWNTRDLRRDDYLLFTGVAMAAVAVMLGIHTLTHHGMQVFGAAKPAASEQIELLSRLVLAGALFLAPRFTRARLRIPEAVGLTVLLTVGLVGAALHTGMLPDALEARPSLLLLQPGSKILVGLLLLGALASHWRARAYFHPRVLAALTSAIGLAVAAELAFALTPRIGVPGLGAAHLAQLLSFVLLYWALVRLNLAEPYTLMLRELSRSIRNLEREASRDELTGLYNRRGLTMLGEAQLALAHRLGLRLTVVFADLNGLKDLNDEHGHAWGDQALQDTAALLRNTFREADVLARIGGDEFVVLLAHGNGLRPVERLREELARFVLEQERPYRLSIALGAAVVEPGSPSRLDDILAQADQEMYTDKQLHYAQVGGRPRS
jgi:diguanylate cyclase (GGDEF)-like protein